MHGEVVPLSEDGMSLTCPNCKGAVLEIIEDPALQAKARAFEDKVTLVPIEEVEQLFRDGAALPEEVTPLEMADECPHCGGLVVAMCSQKDALLETDDPRDRVCGALVKA